MSHPSDNFDSRDTRDGIRRRRCVNMRPQDLGVGPPFRNPASQIASSADHITAFYSSATAGTSLPLAPDVDRSVRTIAATSPSNCVGRCSSSYVAEFDIFPDSVEPRVPCREPITERSSMLLTSLSSGLSLQDSTIQVADPRFSCDLFLMSSSTDGGSPLLDTVDVSNTSFNESNDGTVKTYDKPRPDICAVTGSVSSDSSLSVHDSVNQAADADFSTGPFLKSPFTGMRLPLPDTVPRIATSLSDAAITKSESPNLDVFAVAGYTSPDAVLSVNESVSLVAEPNFSTGRVLTSLSTANDNLSVPDTVATDETSSNGNNDEAVKTYHQRSSDISAAAASSPQRGVGSSDAVKNCSLSTQFATDADLEADLLSSKLLREFRDAIKSAVESISTGRSQAETLCPRPRRSSFTAASCSFVADTSPAPVMSYPAPVVATPNIHRQMESRTESAFRQFRMSNIPTLNGVSRRSARDDLTTVTHRSAVTPNVLRHRRSLPDASQLCSMISPRSNRDAVMPFSIRRSSLVIGSFSRSCRVSASFVSFCA